MSHLITSKSLYGMLGCVLVERLPFIYQALGPSTKRNKHPPFLQMNSAEPPIIQRKLKQTLYGVIIPVLSVRKPRL